MIPQMVNFNGYPSYKYNRNVNFENVYNQLKFNLC